MKESYHTLRVCPVCGCAYTQKPALSRKDNETLICPDCDVREALSLNDIPKAEIEEIIKVIHRSGEESA